jgi:phosphatidylserine/phosphatidylglycerophosphate/cardiolipin synthase-like enzyme
MENTTIKTAIGREFPKKIIPLIDNAKSSVYIMVYEWLWYADQIGASIQLFNNAIVRAKQRGVEIKAVVWRKGIADIIEKLGIKVKWIGQSRMLHVKMMIIDNKIIILGSHNYTKTAFDLNFEASVIIDDENIAKEFTDFFESFFI